MDSLLKPKNCSYIKHADALSFLIDGSDYFSALRESLLKARYSVYILSWDIDSRIELVRDNINDGYPRTLGDLLNFIVKINHELHVYIMNWDFYMIYALDREFLPIYKFDWKTHPRVHFSSYNYQPQGASQHQKIVVIDDSVAFLGGLDITKGRWDTSEHIPDNTLRDRMNGDIARPYHDVQVMVQGRTAAALGELARDHWHKSTGKKLKKSVEAINQNIWPEHITPDIEHVMAGISLTRGEYKEQKETREIQNFYIDAIHSAEKYIYIENQYFTAPSIADALIEKLKHEEGPEIIIILPLKTDGWLSQYTMDVYKIRQIKNIMKNDAYNRFSFYYPDGPGLDRLPINVHAKLMIIDDRIATVGSANLNNRSMALDNECNIVIDAQDDTKTSDGIAHFLYRLLAEHLGTSVDNIQQTLQQKESLANCIKALNDTRKRNLQPLPLDLEEEVDNLIPEVELLDPEHPLKPELMIQHIVPPEEQKPARSRIISWIIMITAIAGFSALWRWTPLNQWVNLDTLSIVLETMRNLPAAPLILITGFVLAGFVAFPFSLLIVATVLAFGTILGFIYSLIGGILSALILYKIGDLLGRNTVRKLAGSKLNQISKKISKHGIVTIMAVRIIPVAPFTIINLVAGASHINFKDYLLGTLLGMIPGMMAVTVVADRVYATIKNPEMSNSVILAVTVLIVIVAGFLLVRWLMQKYKNNKND